MGKLKLTWNGHSCFTLEENGYAIVLDPYEDGAVPGFGPLKLTADEVLCSHGHGDHNAAQCVKIRKNSGGAKNPFRITEIHSFHDEAKGTKRGKNTIRIFDDGQYRIAHMGDIGCVPTADQKEQLKGIDVMLMPVGGFFTLEPEDVYALVKELSPSAMMSSLPWRNIPPCAMMLSASKKIPFLCPGMREKALSFSHLRFRMSREWSIRRQINPIE